MITGLLPDHELVKLAADEHLIQPFEASYQDGQGLSWGLQSYGYDIRLGGAFRHYEPSDVPLDPHWPVAIEETTARFQHTILMPGHSMLARSIEVVRLPRDMVAYVFNKSSLLSRFVFAAPMVLEPGWAGQVELRIVNLGRRPVALREGDGIAQVQFMRTEVPPVVAFCDRPSRYREPVIPPEALDPPPADPLPEAPPPPPEGQP